MRDFKQRFTKVLKEDIDKEKEEFELSLDDDTDAGEFDIDVDADAEATDELKQDPALKAAEAHSEMAVAMVNTLKSWIAKNDEYLQFLNNSEDPNSIQSALSNAESDTIFDRMSQSEQRKIAKVATEIASLNESFKGYLAQADNAGFRHV